jgi:putative radical SAM enzyme (TIGR03279 family)
MSQANQIAFVRKGSVAAENGIEPLDIIESINNVKLEDIFDYYYYEDEPEFDMVILKPNGDRFNLHIVKGEGEDLGISFENGLMDEYRSCHNKCIFCFIDQMPPNMRETLYFKDDDTRLSFLQGNYVTLTNMKEEDLDRIIKYHLAPINISVQATNPELRKRMLHNRFAGDIMDKIKKLADAGIEMNAQIVLCKGVNDGEELERSIRELYEYYPQMQSMSVVPVGLSKYRDGLYPLEPFERDDAREVLDIIHRWQDKAYEETGMHFVQASDEWYLTAELPLPEADRYDGYIQLENGVGMIRLLMDEFRDALDRAKRKPFMKKKTISLATGKLAAPFIEELSQELMRKFPKVDIRVYTIVNNFFGERITVSGLITGQDLIAQLKDVELGEKLLIPQNMVRQEERDFLDDITVAEASETLQVPIDIVKSSGQDFVDCMLS